MNDFNWHSVSKDELLATLNTSAEGLSQEEAERRLDEYGPNAFGEEAQLSWLKTLIAQLQNPLVYVLAIAAVISLIAGHPTDAAVIMAVVVLNTIIGFIQEYRAEQAMSELAKFAAPKARLRRLGKEREANSADVVPGDVMLLAAGDRIPADGRLLEAVNMEADEAALTGESEPVDKSTDVLAKDTPLADRQNMVYSGTVVTRGRGIAVTTATGTETEFGKIAEEVRGTERHETPLQVQLGQLGKMLGLIALGLALLVFLIGIIRGIDLFEMFLFAVAAAVAAIPEGLPAVVTIGLAIGLKAMARRNAIIRRLPAVESLGSATVIMSDKTGTLTQNRMTVEAVYTPVKSAEVTGENIATDESITQLLTVATLANDSELKMEDGNITATGDPTEAALVVAAVKHNLLKPELETRCRRIAEIPFESERGYMATLNKCPEGNFICVKGMPEVIRTHSSNIQRNGSQTPVDKDVIQELINANTTMGGRALRVLGVAYKKVPDDKTELAESDLQDGLIHLGLIGMIDPPRPEAIEAVDRCRSAGIRVIMATGDNRNTARAIAGEFGMIKEDTLVVDGVELAKMTDDELREEIDRIAVFARVEPAQKLRIANILKDMGEIVAMTGDGVNDAPALKTADIGVAMGITGTGVAREAGDMILADDNFATIVAAVEEGRIVFDRIRKVVSYLVATNSGEILTVAVSVAAGWPLPLTAVELLWVNLVTDSAPSLALAVDPPTSDVLARPPRDPKENVINREAMIRLAIVAPVMAAATLGAFFIGNEDSLTLAHTMAFVTLSVSQLYNAINVRSTSKSVFKIHPFSNRWLIVAIIFALLLQALPVYVPVFQRAFDATSLGVREWAIALGLGSFVLWAEEIRKLIRNIIHG